MGQPGHSARAVLGHVRHYVGLALSVEYFAGRQFEGKGGDLLRKEGVALSVTSGSEGIDGVALRSHRIREAFQLLPDEGHHPFVAERLEEKGHITQVDTIVGK